MIDTGHDIPRAAVRGVASGVLLMALFGTLWTTIGLNGLQGWGTPWPLLAALLVGVALLGGGGALWRGAGRLGDRGAGAEAGAGRRAGVWFGIIFGLEGAAIGVASYVCVATGRADLFVPVMALIVGIHFFPLAWLFQYGAHYLTGALLCLVGIVTLVAVPATATLGGREVLPRWLVAGFGCAVILWGTGLLLWIRGERLLRGAPQD